ncbi:MAG: cysteine desulfurase family protein [Chlamydiota bacterium]
MKVYLDNNATTVMIPEVWDAMRSMEGIPLNPSSTFHQYGQKARSLLEASRKNISDLLGASPRDLFFTSSATEAAATLIGGIPQDMRIITTKIEHSCVHENVLRRKTRGNPVIYLPVELSGHVSLQALKAALEEPYPRDTLLILSSVNSEVGALLPLEEIAEMAHAKNAYLLIDAVAQVGKEPLKLLPGISALFLSAHKFHGPKGVGFFYADPLFPFKSLLLGGPQEHQKRAGTENVEGILGLNAAFSLAQSGVKGYKDHMETLRDAFERRLFDLGITFEINGQGRRICNVSNLHFPGIDAEALLIALDQRGVCASSGSACGSGQRDSRVLTEIGFSREKASCSVRFSLSRQTTEEEISYAADCIARICQNLRR